MRFYYFLISITVFFCQCSTETPKQTNNTMDLDYNTITIPSLAINGENTHNIAKAYRIAIGDIIGNIQYHKSGVLDHKKACLYAGLLYGKPWTRDAAINIWNGFGLLSPETSKNTLLAQVERNNNQNAIIAGQYWDKIIWSIGAWEYYLYTGDKEFLEFAFDVTQNTLSLLEDEEFSDSLGLFRGPAVYGDGVAAYPVIYTSHQDKEKAGSYSGIYQWATVNDKLKAKKGYGMPMCALSTNCVYYKVYNVLNQMADELNKDGYENWQTKADKLYDSINKHFWNNDKKNYNYLVDPFGNSDAQEGMGISFALLFEVANREKAEYIFKNTVIESAGIPCIYPTFRRYRNDSLDSYGRHSGTVWPHIQGFWADAAIKYDQSEIFLHEFNMLTKHVLRDFQFVEIYHPKTGLPYGGIQEPHLQEWLEWFCAERQTWSATAYLRMILMDIIGMNFSEAGIAFQPFLPDYIEEITLLNLKYRKAILDIYISGEGKEIISFKINDVKTSNFSLHANVAGKQKIEIEIRDK